MKEKNILLVTAEMGFGHLRAIKPLSDILQNPIIELSKNDNSSEKEKKRWNKIRNQYEYLSRCKDKPIIGKLIYPIFNQLLKIPTNTTKDLSSASYQVKLLSYFIRKKNICNGILSLLKKKENSTLLTSFYAPAIANDIYNKTKSYCIICDSDINRVWVSKNPKESNITYFSPCQTASNRLKQYGIDEKNIILTGFPFPKELIGNTNKDILINNFTKRLSKLTKNEQIFLNLLKNLDFASHHSLTSLKDNKLEITLAIGGAGAQKNLAKKIIEDLENLLLEDKVKLNLVTGIKGEVKDYFTLLCQKAQLENINIVYADNFDDYYNLFNKTIANTDILITKPSELTFYCALGLPILLTEPIGYQEEKNKQWAFENNFALNFPYHESLDKFIEREITNNTFAEIATNAFKNNSQNGVYQIIDYIEKQNSI